MRRVLAMLLLTILWLSTSRFSALADAEGRAPAAERAEALRDG